MFKKTIKHKNTAAKISALLCLICGATLFILAGNSLIAIPVLAQAISIILIVAAIYIASAYLLREYTYSIEPNTRFDEDAKNQYDFIITERKSNKQATVCHVEMNDVTAINVIDPANRKMIRSERKNMKRYTYDTRFAASKQIEIRFTLDDEEYSVMVSYDEELLDTFKKLGK